MIDEKDLEFNADEDDVIVLQGPDGEEVEFVVVDDEDVIDEVFTEYNRLYDEQNS